MNDTLGHLAGGDTVLVEIAKRLKECVRDSDMCCRIGGGDEFTVILKKIKDKQSLEKLANAMIENLSKPIETDEGVARIGVSIGGVAIYPSDGSSYDELVHSADTAMYQAKMAGKGCVRFSE